MAYPESKPIYDTYEKLVTEIIASKQYKKYATNKIDALDESLMSIFKQIRNKALAPKEWPSQ